MVASADFDPRGAQYSLNLRTTSDGVLVPGGDWLLTAQFGRIGEDLVLHGANGNSAIIPSYFAAGDPVPLTSDSGARLDGTLVELLAGSRAPLQFAETQLAQASDASGAIGKVLEVEGVVQVSRADGSQAQLAQGDAVFLKDVIQAAADGKIAIGFVDGTSFALSDGARMTLDDLVFNPGGSDNVFAASVLKGTFVFLTGQIAPSGSMDVTTPVGTIGVRGTKVACKLALEGAESVITLLTDPNGHVGIVEIRNAAGTRILDQANETTRVLSFFILPSEPVVLTQPEILQFFDDAIRHLDKSNGTGPGNSNQGGSTGRPDATDTASATEGQLDQAATQLGEFVTAAGPEQLAAFIPPPGAPIPEAFVLPTFTTLSAGGVIDLGSGPISDSSGNTAEQQPADTRTQDEQIAAPPPPPPSPYTVVPGGPGNDTLGGGPGRLQVLGNGGDDSLTGGDLDDILDGGDGDDVLDAGPGDDVVQGGPGNDLIIGGSGAGNDALDGGADTDTVKYQSATLDINVNLTTGQASGDPVIGTDTLSNIENVIGGSGNDTITGNATANLLEGGIGNDAIAGVAGDDTLIGGAGDDRLTGGAGNDLLQGGGDGDTAVLSGDRSDYTVTLESGQIILTDNRVGGDGTDTLEGIETVQFADKAVSAADLTNTNVAPTEILLSNSTIDENAVGAVIGTISVTDPDFGDTHTFTLSDARFQIVGGQLVLAPGESLDFEAEPSISIDITAKDAGNLTFTQNFIINVIDVNEPPSPPIDNNIAANLVSENAADGTAVGITAHATDPDAGDSVTYDLTDDAGGRFAINAATGVVTVADGSLLNFESATSHQITVRATSAGGLSSEQIFTINVTDANEPPSVPLDSDNTANQVLENAANGTIVGITTLSLDPDAGDAVVYSLTDDAGGRFAIDADTGVVSVADGSLLDFESATSHDIKVRATSNGGLFAEQTFTIAVTNVETGPVVDGYPSANEVAENAVNGAAVGITASVDADAGDVVTYSLTDDAGGRFAIDSVTGIVTVANGSLLDFESATSHDITIRATINGGLFTEQTLTIDVIDVNEAPSAPADSDGAPNSVAENAANGTPVGITAASVDPDAGEIIVYSLTDDAGGRFAISATTGVVTVADGSLLDFEDQTSHQITVQTSSSGGLATTQTFFINVTNVNEPPSSPVDGDGAVNSIAEDAPNGTPVGITASAGDPDAGDTVTYSLTDDAGGRFAIDAGTGIVTVADNSLLDVESATAHEITVRATSNGGLFTEQIFTINVTNANELGQVTDSDPAFNTVVETAALGTEVGITGLAIDPDAGDTVSYSLTNDAGGQFAIDLSSGVVTVASSLTVGSHSIEITATDNHGLSTSQSFSIDVTSVDNSPPSVPADSDATTNSVAENAANGTLVGITATSTDPDAGDVVSYSLTDDAGGRFAINAATGVVSVANGTLLDFESVTAHQITVRATSNGGLFTEQTFAIAVTNANEQPSVPVDSDAAPNTVAENALNGTTAAITAFADDPDSGDVVSYSLTNDAGGRFAIDAGTGVVTVANGSLLDFEGSTSHNITVRATSNGGFFTEQTFNISVTNVNEPPSIPADADGTLNVVAENAANGTMVGVMALASDPDAGDSVTYSLTNDAGGRFAIDAGTGVVTVANGALLDFETQTSHQITVQAASNGGLATTQTFTINVADVNEPPGTPTDGNGAANQVVENATNGTLVGITASSIDPDVGDAVSYSLTDDAGGRFAINATSGAVTVANGSLLDFEDAASHDITVRATSNGGLFTERTFTIVVTDANEPPSIPVDGNAAADSVAENATNGTLVGITAASTDPDAGHVVTYSLTDDAGGRFAINATTGVVTVANGALLDFETATSHDIIVRASSNGGLFTEQTFTIAVTNVNEPPSTPIDGNAAANSVAENAANGTTVGITAFSTDPDAGDAVSYSLTDSAGGRFAINSATGVVTVADGSLLNFENLTSHQITARATSSGGLFTEQTFAIAVSDVNEGPSGPVDSDAAPNAVAENAANGTVVGFTALSVDPDASDPVTYSLASDAGGRFAIDPTTGIVTVADGSLLNFENATSHQISVKATSSGGLFSIDNFVIAVTDVNEAPAITSNGGGATASITVPENETAVTTVVANDPDVGDTITYSIGGGFDGNLFSINATTGALTFNPPQDFENPDLNGGTFDYLYDVLVRATDSSGKFDEQLITVSLADVNEAPSTPVDQDASPNTVGESVENGTSVGITANAIDPDSADAVTYSLSDDAGGRFAINAITGEVTVANGSALDFEDAASHEITVRATSNGGLFSEQGFTIAITNIDELGAVSDNDPAPNTVAANAPIGATVGITGLAIDPDVGDTVTYSLTDDAGGLFAIDPSNGVVTVAAPLLSGSYSIEITATDNHGLSRFGTFSIDVTSVGGNAPPDLVNSTLIAAKLGTPDLVHETELKVTDSDTAANQIVYTLTVLPVLGALLLNGTTLALGDSFTQQDIADGHLEFQPTGFAGGPDSFQVDITDGVNTLSGQLISVSIIASGAVPDGDVGTPNVSDPLIVGDTTIGRLNIVGGANVTAALGVTVGNTATGNGFVVVTDSGSTLTAGGAGIQVGKAGSGFLILGAGSVVETNRLVIGADIGGSGNVTVLGGAELHAKGTGNGIIAGGDGVGNLQVEEGGVVTALQLILGDKGSSSLGLASVNGPGAELVISTDDGLFAALDQENAGLVVIGNDGTGILNVTAGGHLEIRAGESANTGTTNPLLLVGRNLLSAGTVSVTGEGSSVELRMSAAADPTESHDLLRGPGIAVGLLGTGNLEIADKAIVSLTGDEAFVSVGVGNYLDPDDTTEFPVSTLTVMTGGKLQLTDATGNDGGLIIGDFQGGNGVVSVVGEGSVISVDSNGGAAVGLEGTGTLMILEGGKVEIQSDGFNNLRIGETEYGAGDVIVSGSGSTLATSGTDNTIQVGYYGGGVLTVSDGGLVTTLYLGIGRYGDGVMTIQDDGSKVVVSNDSGNFSGSDAVYAGAVNVGRSNGSFGSLEIKDGGALEIRAGETVNTDKVTPILTIGTYYGSIGIVDLSGPGSSITVSMAGPADPGDIHPLLAGPAIVVGGMGVGQMFVYDHANINITGDEAYLDVGTGNWQDPDDETEFFGGYLHVSEGAKIQITDSAGGNGGLLVGDWKGGNGDVVVTGAGSLLAVESQGGADIGNQGTGALAVTSGAAVTIASDSFNNLNVGYEAGSHGIVQVIGDGSKIVTSGVDNTIQVGRYGDGQLHVSTGGLVSTLQFEIARSGSGVATISGDGSRIIASNDGGLFSGTEEGYAGFVRVGRNDGSFGQLLIDSGGVLEIRPGETVNNDTKGAELTIGQEAGSTGIVSVDGIGSAIVMGGVDSFLQVGRYGTGSLSVTGGAQVTAQFVEFGRLEGGLGNGTVSGAGSAINAGGYDSGVSVGRYGTGSLTISAGGFVTTDNVQIGRGETGNGAIVVTGTDSQLVTAGTDDFINIGRYGQGSLKIYDGGLVQTNSANIGDRNTGVGDVIVSGAGSKLVTQGVDNQVQVGRVGEGVLTVEQGGVVKTLNFVIGRDGTGDATIDGPGSKVIVSNDEGLDSDPYAYEAGFVRVSRSDGSNASLSIINGGQLEIRSGIGQNTETYAAALSIGRDASSNGHVLVSGAGSLIHITQEVVPTGPLKENGPYARLQGHGSLIVQDQGQVTIEGVYASLRVGESRYADAHVEVIGGGSILIDNKGVAGGLAIGGDFLGVSTGAVHVGGAGSSIIVNGDGNLIGVGDSGNGSLSIDDGGLVEGEALSVGYGGVGNVTVTGGGSTLKIDGTNGIRIGTYGSGELHVAGGGQVLSTSDNFNTLDIAAGSGGNGWVTVDGAGSLIQTFGLDNTVQVGRYGTGTLEVTNGGVVSTLQFEVGRSGTGTATISGSGSKIIASNDGGLFSDPFAFEAGFVRIGGHYASNGTLAIDNGGVLEIRPGENTDTNSAGMQIADEAGSTGAVSVSGPGSAINISGPDSFIEVGRSGTGSLGVTDGAQVTAQFVGFGINAGGYGTGLVAGAGSAINAGGYNSGIAVGRYGSGWLTVTTGGFVTTNNIGIGQRYGSYGSVLVTDAGSQLVTAGVDNTISVGDEGEGTLTVNSGATVKTLNLQVANNGVGTVSISGVGTQVIVSNDEGLDSDPYAYEAGFVRVSRSDGSSGSLFVTDGAHLEIRSGIGQNTDTYGAGMNIGRETGSSGHVLVSGPGSLIQITQDVVPPGPHFGYGPFLGVRGQSSLIVEYQGQVIVQGPYAGLGVGNRTGSDATLEVTSGGIILVDNKDHGGGMSIGNSPNATGFVHVTGQDSSIILSGDGNHLSVGSFGSGSLLIEDRGLVKALSVGIGYQGEGSVTVGGTGSSLIVSNDEGVPSDPNQYAAGNISLFGTAALQVVNGGRVEVRDGTQNPNAQRASIDVNGLSNATTGLVRVAGPGSAIFISQTALSTYGPGSFSGATLALSSGIAIARIENYGQLVIDSMGANLSVGGQAGSEGHLEVLSGGTVLVDGEGHEAGLFVGGWEPGSYGSVLISGSGSSLTILGGLGYQGIAHVGYAAAGAITVTDGGELNVEDGSGNGDAVHAWAFGRIDGGGGTIVANNVAINGVLSATTDAAAHMTIQSDLWFNGGTLEVDAGGTAPGQFDNFDVSGKVDFFDTNKMVFHFLNGFLPHDGDNFAFLTAGGALNFDPTNLEMVVYGAKVAGGFGFDVSQVGSSLVFTAPFSDADTTATDGLSYQGSFGNDVFTATDGDDALYGRAGNDTLSAGSGNDLLDGGSGHDRLDGGSGADRYVFDHPNEGDHVASNIPVSLAAGATGDTIANFDATIGTGDTFIFNSDAFGVNDISSQNFSTIAAEYDGTLGLSEQSDDYAAKAPSFIVDGANHLIYDSNGSDPGYTVVATVEVAPGSPAITENNLQAA